MDIIEEMVRIHLHRSGKLYQSSVGLSVNRMRLRESVNKIENHFLIT